MADIKLRGYVSKPQTKTSSKGPYSTFTLSETIKDPKAPNGKRKAFYNITNFQSGDAPPDGSYVTIEGWFKPRDYEQNGVKRTSLDILAQQIEVSPPRDGARPAAPAPAANTDAEDWAF